VDVDDGYRHDAPDDRGVGAAAAPARRGRQRRRYSAGAALAAMLLGFFLAGLLDAAALHRDVETMPIGARRTALLWLIRPMTALGDVVGLDEPAQALDRALDRGDDAHHARGELVNGDGRPIWPREITDAAPLRLYIAGDSMAGQFGRPLAALAEETSPIETRVDYHVSSGLSRPEYFDWPQRLIDMVVESGAEAVVFLVGGNDAQDVKWEGRVLHVDSRAWLDLYRLRVAEAMEIATAGGRRVYWVGQPIMKDDTYRERMAMLNRVYEEVAATHDGVTYIDTWEMFADEDGEYAAYLHDASGDRVRMRQGDGIHLTRAGADRLSARVLAIVREDWGMDGGAE
jgi:lysophospholipase L1-like esterase